MQEATEILAVKNPAFQSCDSSMWHDNEPTQQKTPAHEEALNKADMKLDALNKDARAAAFEHDKLQLARDIAQIAQLVQCVDKSEKAERLRRITHMRAENSIGASIVENFMLENALHRSGAEHDMMKLLDQARV